MPNGTITKVTPGSDLAFALKGGLNRFGVVTDITFKTYAQGDVYVSPPNPRFALVRIKA